MHANKHTYRAKIIIS